MSEALRVRESESCSVENQNVKDQAIESVKCMKASMSFFQLQTQDLFLHGTKSKCSDVVGSTWHVSIQSNQVPETI